MNTALEKTQKEGESENPDVLGVTQEADMFDRLDSSMNSEMQNTLRATVKQMEGEGAEEGTADEKTKKDADGPVENPGVKSAESGIPEEEKPKMNEIVQDATNELSK